MKTVMVSGGFDPIHVGHLDYLEGASEYGEVVVVLNSDDWLKKKKGYAFMLWMERARLLNALSVVHEVISSFDDSDGTICKALRLFRPDYFANGGDRTEANLAEHEVCRELGITMLFNIGGPKIRSSSELVRAAR